MQTNKKEKRKIVILLLTLTAASTMFLMIFSLATSCLYDHKFIGWDSDIFLAMGKFSKAGLIPYREFFDHKGPWIILIQWLGYVFGNGKPGVFIIQVIFLTVSLLGIYKILRLYYKEKISLFLTVASLLIINIYFDKGNLTEEYCIPFLIWSTYLAVKFLKSGDKEHKCIYSFLYGITFMVGAMTRLTNSIPIVLFILAGLVLLIKIKAWKNIIKNALSFFTGNLIVLIPTVIYFLKVGALKEMLYATFVYNFKHGFEKAPLTYSEVVNLAALAVPLVIAFVFGVMTIYIRKSKPNHSDELKKMSFHPDETIVIGIIIVILSGAALLLLAISRPYAHYLMVWIPTIVLAMGFMRNLWTEKKIFCIIAFLLCSFVAVGKVATAGMEIHSVLKSDYVQNFESEAQKIVSKIPKGDRDKVIVYNVKAYFYLTTDLKPCYKNFNHQDLHTGMDDVEREEFLNDLESLKAKYIITGISEGIYSPFIEEYYELIENTDKFQLFIRK